MMQANRRIHDGLQLVLDVLCLKLIWVCSIQARISLNPFLSEHVTGDKATFWTPPLMLILPLWLATSLRFRLYQRSQKAGFWSVPISAFENTVVLTMVAAVVTFFSRQFGELVSRMFVPAMLPIAFVLLAASRYIAIALTPLGRQHWEKPLRLALVGDWEKARQFLGSMQPAQASLFRGLIVPEGDLARAQGCRIPVLGTTRQIAELINQEGLNRIAVLNASLPQAELEHCSGVCRRMDVPISCLLEFSTDPIHLNVSTSYGPPFVEVIPVRFTRRQEIVKRIFDVIVAAASIMLLSPVLAAIAVLIKATSEGPVLHTSSRIGKGGRQFTFFKFRSMYLNSDRSMVAAANEKTGHIFKIRRDPRVTPVGRFIRRYSLDELPQLANILRGDMSFVGPRPLPARDLDPDGMSTKYVAWSEGRSKVQPGLTGLWQISGRSELPFEDMVRLDLDYIQNWSLLLDLQIMRDTPLLVLRGDGAF